MSSGSEGTDHTEGLNQKNRQLAEVVLIIDEEVEWSIPGSRWGRGEPHIDFTSKQQIEMQFPLTREPQHPFYQANQMYSLTKDEQYIIWKH